MKDDQNWWNFIFTLLFILQLAVAIWILTEVRRMPVAIPVFDFILLSLAAFRLTRLIVYDKVAQFVRDWFLDVTVMEGDAGERVTLRSKPAGGPRRTMAELLACPWCFGIWAALFTAFFYYLTPVTWFVILILAIAGVGSFIQILANVTGWKAELYKQQVGQGPTQQGDTGL